MTMPVAVTQISPAYVGEHRSTRHPKPAPKFSMDSTGTAERWLKIKTSIDTEAKAPPYFASTWPTKGTLLSQPVGFGPD